MVVLYHCLTRWWPFSTGWTGVTVFFVLSGYLITRLSLRSEESGGFSFRVFWVKRATRIVPLYYLTALGFVATTLFGEHRVSIVEAGQALLAYVTFNGEFAVHPMTVAWSLGVEEKFYLLWPLIAFLFLRQGWSRTPLALTAGSALLLLAVMAPSITAGTYLGAYGALLLGAGAALLEQRRPDWLADWSARSLVGWSAAAAAVLVVCFARPDGPNGWIYATLVPAVAILVLHCTHGSSALVAWLSSRVMSWLGSRSYALYLVHTLVFALVVKVVRLSDSPHELAAAFVCVAISLLVAELAHRTVEAPMIRLGRRWASARSRRSDLATTAGSGTVQLLGPPPTR